jgi:hypothetical protein
MDHVCQFSLKSNNIFICDVDLCKKIHVCGLDECDYLFYNTDQTQVCGVTGLCFNQRVCENYIDTQRGIRGSDPVYIKRQKRDQQLKNRSLEYEYTMTLLSSIDTIVMLSSVEKLSLCKQILSLWQSFVMCTQEKKCYTHRKDKRCFVIAIAMSISTGICSNMGQYIVLKHDDIHVNKLNKKSKYDTFKVADIRGGTNLLINGFKNVKLDPCKTIDLHTYM